MVLVLEFLRLLRVAFWRDDVNEPTRRRSNEKAEELRAEKFAEQRTFLRRMDVC
jgi:hypothetical protein